VPGTYALVLACAVEGTIEIGRLGELRVRPGYYVYVGSAFGPGGVAARIRHHLRPAARPHWHVDYLRAVTRVEEIWYTHDASRCEHAWAGLLAGARGSSTPLVGFGASDCACATHLVYCSARPSWPSFRRRARDCRPARWIVQQLMEADR
jgi:Uri superfamily endonuclease